MRQIKIILRWLALSLTLAALTGLFGAGIEKILESDYYILLFIMSGISAVLLIARGGSR